MSTSLGSQYNELMRAFDTRPSELERCLNLIAQLKLALINSGLLVPQEQQNHSVEDLVRARDVLEIGAFCSIRSQDIPSFDRYYSLLQTFYSDFASTLPPSPRQYPILGLNLIRLLTLNRIAEFHTVLEALPSKELLSDNPFIQHPVNLERWMMEGSYSKVWNAREEAPAEEYKYFVDSLMGTIRNEIASCGESAYETLPIADATTLLFFNSASELLSFAQQRKWEINLSSQTVSFVKHGEELPIIPKKWLISANLSYARELEQIV